MTDGKLPCSSSIASVLPGVETVFWDYLPIISKTVGGEEVLQQQRIHTSGMLDRQAV